MRRLAAGFPERCDRARLGLPYGRGQVRRYHELFPTTMDATGQYVDHFPDVTDEMVVTALSRAGQFIERARRPKNARVSTRRRHVPADRLRRER
jgi:hypothetical protein